MSATPQSQVVIGALSRLPPWVIEPFATSLRESGFGGRFVIVAAQYPQADLEALGRLADLVVPVDDLFGRSPKRGTRILWEVRSRAKPHWSAHRSAYELAFRAAVAIGPKRRRVGRWQQFEFHLEGLLALRYALYRDVLEAELADASAILLTDLRDVIFQADPFSAPLSGLEVFLEDQTQRVGSELFNRRWIRNLYGAAELAHMADATVSCAGTVIGERHAIIDYLGRMSSEVDAAITRWRGPLGPHDQGIHNWLLRRGGLPGARVVENGTGRVLTMAALTSIDFNEGGGVRNADGTVPAVLHQYDRHSAVAEQLLHQAATERTHGLR